MRTQRFRILTLTMAPTVIVIGLQQAARADDASTNAATTAGLHSPQVCDQSLTLADLANLRAPKAARRYKITYGLVSLAAYWYQATAYGALKAAQEAGVDLTLSAAQGFSTQAQQVTTINNELSRGIDGLLLQPVDVNGAVPIVEAAVAKGVPVVTVGTLVDSTKADALVQDDYAQGLQAAEFFAKKLPGGGEGIIMGGPANGTWASRRVAGLEDGIKKFPQLKIAAITHENVDPAEGLSRFTNASQAHPKVDWIYSTYNLQLPPSSIPEKYAKAVYLGGGYEPLMVDAMKSGAAAGAAASHPVAEGYVGISLLVRKLNGEKLPSITCLPNNVVTSDDLSSVDQNSQNLMPEGWKVTSPVIQ